MIDNENTIPEKRVEHIKSLARICIGTATISYIEAPKGFAEWPEDEQRLFVAELNRQGRLKGIVTSLDDDKKHTRTDV